MSRLGDALAAATAEAARQSVDAQSAVSVARARLRRHSQNYEPLIEESDTAAEHSVHINSQLAAGAMQTSSVHINPVLPQPDRWRSCRELCVLAVPGLLTTLLVLVLNVATAGLIVSDPTLREYTGEAVVMTLASTALGLLVVLPSRSSVPAVLNADAFMAALYANMASDIVRDERVHSPLGTLGAAMAVTSVLAGAFFLLLAFSHSGRAVQFLPSPVVAGYIASVK